MIADLRPPGAKSHALHTAVDSIRILKMRPYGDRTWSIVRSYWRLWLAAHGVGRVRRFAGWHLRGCDDASLALHVESKFLGLEYWFRTTAPRPFIIDCGANVGVSVLFFKTLYPDAEIIAFEPDEHAFAALSANVADNRLPNVTLHPCAVGGESGTAQLYAAPGARGTGQASMRPWLPPAEIVNVVHLSPYIDRPVDFLKLDIEGSEMEVLRELAAAGALAQVREMVVEYHHHANGEADALSGLFALLEQAGFGYFVSIPFPRPFERGVFQDVLVHAYGRSSALGP